MKKSKILKRIVAFGIAFSMFATAGSVEAGEAGKADTQVDLAGVSWRERLRGWLAPKVVGAAVVGALGHIGGDIFSGMVKEIGSAFIRPFTEILLASGWFNPDTWTIGQYLTDLTEQAENGEGQDAIGRDEEIDSLINILSQEGKANVCIVGEPGVGKTALVEGLAYRIATGDVPDHFKDKRIIKVNMVSLIAGNAYSKPDGAVTRMKALFDKAKDSNVILFMDEFHQIAKCGFADLFKTYLDRPGVHVIAATTTAEYSYIESDPALERRFKKLVLDELGAPTTLEVLKDIRPKFENRLNVRIADKALDAAVDLTGKYMRTRAYPDKAIDVMSLAAVRVSRKNVSSVGDKAADVDVAAVANDGIASKLPEVLKVVPEVTEKDILEVVMAETGIPLGPLTEKETKFFSGMQARLSKCIVGQESAVCKLCDAVYNARSGFVNDSKPKSAFLLTGTHGVGKTALAECIGKETSNLVKLDVAHSGFTDGFLEKIWKKPYSVVLFDNLDRADRNTFDKILSILENGFTYDSRKRKIDFTNSVVLMTSNVGESTILSSDISPNVLKTMVQSQVEQSFGINFVNCLDDVIIFNKLCDSDVKSVVKIFVDDIVTEFGKKNIKLFVNDDVIDHISKSEINHKRGAFELKKMVESLLKKPLSVMCVNNSVKNGDTVLCSLSEGKIKLEVGNNLQS